MDWERRTIGRGGSWLGTPHLAKILDDFGNFRDALRAEGKSTHGYQAPCFTAIERKPRSFRISVQICVSSVAKESHRHRLNTDDFEQRNTPVLGAESVSGWRCYFDVRRSEMAPNKGGQLTGAIGGSAAD
jgi:hypothetical protein